MKGGLSVLCFDRAKRIGVFVNGAGCDSEGRLVDGRLQLLPHGHVVKFGIDSSSYSDALAPLRWILVGTSIRSGRADVALDDAASLHTRYSTVCSVGLTCTIFI